MFNHLTFYIKLLNLNESIKRRKLNDPFQDTCTTLTDWHTCYESTASIEPYITNRMDNFDSNKVHYATFDNLLEFLDKCEPFNIQKCLQVLLKRDPLRKIFNNFQNLNKRLFNNYLSGIVTRWSDTCPKYII